MKNLIINKLFIMKTTLVVIFFTETFVLTQTISLSFDVLYPKTLYQKTLESLISVWQLLKTLEDKREEGKVIVYKAIVDKLTLAQFYLEQLKKEKNQILSEDYEYLVFVNNRIKGFFCEGLNPSFRVALAGDPV